MHESLECQFVAMMTTGVQLEESGGAFVVRRVVPGSSAEHRGLRAADSFSLNSISPIESQLDASAEKLTSKDEAEVSRHIDGIERDVKISATAESPEEGNAPDDAP